MRSNAAFRSASSTHRRAGFLPLTVLKVAWIASWQLRPGRNPYDLGSNRASHSGSNAAVTRACKTRSAITGIPSGRRRPSAFGIYTPFDRTGLPGLLPPVNSVRQRGFVLAVEDDPAV